MGNWSSYSGITTHRGCPQRWQYSYIQNYQAHKPDDAKVHLYFGNWWHALRAVDSIARGREAGTLQYAPDEIHTVDDGPILMSAAEPTTDEVMELADKWFQQLSQDHRDEWQSALGGTVLERLVYLDARWHDQWDEESVDEAPLAVEMGWGRNLASGTRLVGYIDEAYLDRRRNLVVIRDHKTTSRMGIATTLDDMMDSQLQLYSWGAAPTIEEWGFGPVRAVAYDRVRSTAPKTPRLNQTGTLSKSVSDFDLHTYLTWTAAGQEYPGRLKDGSGAGVYQVDPDMVASLSDPAARSAWLQRTLTPVNREVVRAHLMSAEDTSHDMENTRERVERNGEAGRNLTSNCKWCPYAELCRAQMLGGVDGEYDLSLYGLRAGEKSGR